MKRKVYRSNRKITGGRYYRQKNSKSYQKKRIGLPVKIGPSSTYTVKGRNNVVTIHPLLLNTVNVSSQNEDGVQTFVQETIVSVHHSFVNPLFKNLGILTKGTIVNTSSGRLVKITNRVGRQNNSQGIYVEGN